MVTRNVLCGVHEEVEELAPIPWRLSTLRLMRQRLHQDQTRKIPLIKPRMIHPSPSIPETHHLLPVIEASCLPLMKKPGQQLQHSRCFKIPMILIGLHPGKMIISGALVYGTTLVIHKQRKRVIPIKQSSSQQQIH